MFKKITTKNTASTAATIGSSIAGAALSDGIVGLVPEQYRKYGKPVFALACAIAAAAIDTKKTGGKITQGAFAGMSIKQGLDSLRELLLTKLPENDANTEVGKFANRVLGLGSTEVVQVPKIITTPRVRTTRTSPEMLASNASNGMSELVA